MSPRRSLLLLFGMLLGLALVRTWSDVGLYLVGLVALLTFGGIPLHPLLSRLRPFLLFAAVTLVFGGLGDGEPLVSIGPLHWGAESVNRAALAAARLLLLGVSVGWLSLLGGGTRLLSALWPIRRHLERLGINTEPLFVALGVAVRFLPLLQDEAMHLRLAWNARGAELLGRGPVGRIKYGAGLIIPLLAAVLRRAEAFAEAVEVRSRGGPPLGGSPGRVEDGAPGGGLPGNPVSGTGLSDALTGSAFGRAEPRGETGGRKGRLREYGPAFWVQFAGAWTLVLAKVLLAVR